MSAISGKQFQTRPQIPYVKDGIIMMFDGEWNDGLAIHDQTLNYWKDIITRENASINGKLNSNWTRSSFEFDGSSFFQLSDTDFTTLNCAYLRKNMTIEIVYECKVKHEETSGLFGFCGLPDYSFECRVRQYCAAGYNYNGGDCQMYTAGALQPRIRAGKTSIVMRADGLAATCIDPQYGQISVRDITSAHAQDLYSPICIGNSSGDLTQFIGSIFCLRIYDRALTDEEMMFNLMIDKERFGI